MSERTDEEIQRLSEEAFRHEISPETERLRLLQEARTEIRLACVKLADLYAPLAHGQWAQQGVSLGALVENVVSDVRAEHNKVRHLKSQLDSAELSSQHHSEEAQRNLRRAMVAEKRIEACEAQRAHEANVFRVRIRELESDLAAADDVLASYKAWHMAVTKGGER